jgi:hypothetical protein
MDAATIELTPRQETLLMFVGADKEKELDPVRIMKGMFLFAKETPTDWLPSEARYRFEPYYYGPYSPQIYSDLDQLGGYGYVRAREVPGRSWNHYSLTPEGAEVAQSITRTANPKASQYLRTLRAFVDGLSFRQLLTTVYNRYPDYAVNSVFTG